MDPSPSAQSGLHISVPSYTVPIPRYCIRIEGFIQVFILEGFRSKLAYLRIVVGPERLDIDIIFIVDIEFNSNIRRKNKIGV